jgi:Domain of unknown function (DU1801)
MPSIANTPDEYLAELSDDRKLIVSKLRDTILKNIPKGFEEIIGYGMLGYVVPKSIYPAGYHCNPKLPLPFINLGSQKNYVAFHHMGLYGSEKLLSWFTEEYAKTGLKLDMGKACVRFKSIDKIPFELIAELCKKITPDEWIKNIETMIKK